MMVSLSIRFLVLVQGFLEKVASWQGVQWRYFSEPSAAPKTFSGQQVKLCGL